MSCTFTSAIKNGVDATPVKKHRGARDVRDARDAREAKDARDVREGM